MISTVYCMVTTCKYNNGYACTKRYVNVNKNGMCVSKEDNKNDTTICSSETIQSKV